MYPGWFWEFLNLQQSSASDEDIRVYSYLIVTFTFPFPSLSSTPPSPLSLSLYPYPSLSLFSFSCSFSFSFSLFKLSLYTYTRNMIALRIHSPPVLCYITGQCGFALLSLFSTAWIHIRKTKKLTIQLIRNWLNIRIKSTNAQVHQNFSLTA